MADYEYEPLAALTPGVSATRETTRQEDRRCMTDLSRHIGGNGIRLGLGEAVRCGVEIVVHHGSYAGHRAATVREGDDPGACLKSPGLPHRIEEPCPFAAPRVHRLKLGLPPI